MANLTMFGEYILTEELMFIKHGIKCIKIILLKFILKGNIKNINSYAPALNKTRWTNKYIGCRIYSANGGSLEIENTVPSPFREKREGVTTRIYGLFKIMKSVEY